MLTPEQIADGWKPHDGGPCPVPLDSYPDIMLETGDTFEMVLAGFWSSSRWTGKRGPRQVGRLPSRIIAYREEPSDAA